MGRRIPEPIRRKVLREWLEGHPRQQIAKDNQIGAGTVSEIIKAIKENNIESEIDVLREIAVMLTRKGLSMDDFANSIRLKQYLNEIGLKEENLEDFAIHLEIHCFKRGLAPDAFVNLVANVSSLSEKLGVPVEDLPERINKSKELLDNIGLIRKQKTVAADLEEYRSNSGNRPSLHTSKSKNIELEKARAQIYELRWQLYKRTKNEWRVSDHEIQLVNAQLQRPIEHAELYKLAEDLFHHPSKYVDMIRTMREPPELQSTLAN
jgi:hypothetical protein